MAPLLMWTRATRLAASFLALAAAGAASGQESGSEGIRLEGPAPASLPETVTRDAAGRVTVLGVRIAEPLVIDGKLDDEVYARVRPAGGFVQQEPHEGSPATEPTDIWVFYDDRNVYVSGRCWDSHPERMIVNELRRDHNNVNQNESITVVFDTFYDRRNGVYFQTNPLGMIRDQLVIDEGQSNNPDWNTVWNVRAASFDQGWTFEMAIPFRSLRFRGEREQVWSMNVRRVVRWKNEISNLSAVPAAGGMRSIYKYSSAATLVGLEAPLGGFQFEVKPYAISAVTTNLTASPPVENEFVPDAGFDAKYGITKGLTADFTYNTDFAQVEEDQQQVNLTRFSLFFPEKRDFFLEGQGIFNFGGIQIRTNTTQPRPGNESEELTPILFFSRRIGLAGGLEVPIEVGGRVTGRQGPFQVGALSIKSGRSEEAGVEPTTFNVLRLRRDFLRRSDLGILLTHRSLATSGEGTNAVFGADANFAFYDNLRMNAYYARSRTSALPGATDEASYIGRLDYEADRYGLRLEHLYVGEDFDPDIGFLRRSAFRRSFAKARFSPRPASIESVRKFTWEATLDYITDPEGRLETRLQKGAFEIEFESADRLTLELSDYYEFLEEPFDIAEGVVIPVGGYDFRDARLSYQFGGRRRVPSTFSFRHGSFFDGERTEASAQLRIELSSRFALEPALSRNWVDLPEGAFETTLATARVNYSMSPRLGVSSLLQYNTSNETFQASFRLRWEYHPGSDLFVVWSEGRDAGLTGFPVLDNRTFVVKLTRLVRF
jgi:hypothetical protein